MLNTIQLQKISLFILLTLYIIFTPNSASASSTSTISHAGAFYDADSNNDSYGIDVLINTNSYGVSAYLGVSMIHFSGERIIDTNSREMSNAFFLGGIKSTLPISPFLEFGKDLGESFFNDLISANIDESDYYLSIGVTTSQKYNLGASLYYKLYSFGYTDPTDDSKRSSISLPGLRVFFRFN